ncbi:MAG TPA: isocitrate/isopropylmalate dehydrogenase family protein [Solirubrobacteraceae bacterium]|nr:isocitrate/isopropylmalate dehydrogenase family protein [Solirubrobacteraceae bacterium]
MTATGPSANGRPLRVATIGGDGIGPEVVRAALPALVAAAEGHGASVEITELDWGGDRLLRTGHAMPADGPEELRRHDAVLLGAVGHPALSPSESVWTLVLPIRKALDLFVNLRPIRAWPGVRSPIRGAPRADFVVVRENTEGEYAGIGGRVHEGSPDEVATDVAIHSRRAITRVARYAFELARSRGQTLTLVTKSNVSRHGYALWDEVVFALREAEFPDVAIEKAYVDAMAARLIERPDSLGVLVCSNLFGDILSDAGAPIAGGLGMAPSANISPDRTGPGMFEPVHGSAPDIAGRGVANPIACVLSGVLLLRDVGLGAAADTLEQAVSLALASGECHTPDLGGRATTDRAAAAVHAAVGQVLRAGAAAP